MLKRFDIYEPYRKRQASDLFQYMNCLDILAFSYMHCVPSD